jgi:hypothetical protein
VRRLVLLAGLMAAPVLPVLVAAPAQAVDNVICVLPAATGCNQTVSTVQLAITAANGNSLDNVIQLGAATYSDGPYSLSGGLHALTLKGAGQGSTVISLPASASQQEYINASQATVRDLTITMAAASSTNDHALSVGSGSVVDHVTVNGTGTSSAIGIVTATSTITNSVVTMTPDNVAANRGIYSSGGNTVSDTTVSGAPAFDLSDPNTTDTLSRMQLRTDSVGVLTDGGTIKIDDSLIDLGTADNSVGMAPVNFNNSTSPKTITADHVTIVGGGAGSRGAWAYAAAAGAKQTSTINLTNSIIRGPDTSLVADAGNDGSQGGPSTATLNVSYTDYQNTGGTIAPVTGAGGIVPGAGNLVNVDPAFVSPTDQRLTALSPVIDKGDPGAPVGSPTLDLDGHPRVQDGDGDGSAVRDMGAFEFGDTTPPNTTIDSGPSGPTSDPTPTFTFSATEPSSFVCQVDGGSEAACTSPLTTQTLSDGPHTLTVTATDAASNSDPSPATRQWTVDTVAPDTSISSGPTGLTNDATPTFGFGGEAGATFECRVDTAAYAACTSPLTATVSDGAHTFSVRAKDAATNVDPTPATRTFTVDTAAPNAVIAKAPPKKTTHARIKVKFPWLDTGPTPTFECRLDKGDWITCTSPYKVKVKLGKHTIEVRAIDAAGNVDPTPAKVKFKRIAKP